MTSHPRNIYANTVHDPHIVNSMSNLIFIINLFGFRATCQKLLSDDFYQKSGSQSSTCEGVDVFVKLWNEPHTKDLAIDIAKSKTRGTEMSTEFHF